MRIGWCSSNGRFDADHSHIGALPAGVFLGSFAQWAVKQDQVAELFPRSSGAPDAFRALNQSLFTDGLALVVPAGVTLELPVHVLYWGEAADPASAQLKGLIRIGAGAKAHVIETFAGTGRTWTNAVMSVEVGDTGEPGPLPAAGRGADRVPYRHARRHASARTRSMTALPCRWAPRWHARTSTPG